MIDVARGYVAELEHVLFVRDAEAELAELQRDIRMLGGRFDQRAIEIGARDGVDDFLGAHSVGLQSSGTIMLVHHAAAHRNGELHHACKHTGQLESADASGGDATGGAEEGGCEGCTLVTEGTLTVGSDIPYPPFEFEDEAGSLTGFDVELVRAVAEKLGLENTDDDWISTNFDTIFQQLASNTKFDIVVAAVTAYAPDGSPAAETVAERREAVDFSLAYYPSLQSLTINTSQ